jgi:hypothetical protein
MTEITLLDAAYKAFLLLVELEKDRAAAQFMDDELLDAIQDLALALNDADPNLFAAAYAEGEL